MEDSLPRDTVEKYVIVWILSQNHLNVPCMDRKLLKQVASFYFIYKIN